MADLDLKDYLKNRDKRSFEDNAKALNKYRKDSGASYVEDRKMGMGVGDPYPTPKNPDGSEHGR